MDRLLKMFELDSVFVFEDGVFPFVPAMNEDVELLVQPGGQSQGIGEFHAHGIHGLVECAGAGEQAGASGKVEARRISSCLSVVPGVQFRILRRNSLISAGIIRFTESI